MICPSLDCTHCLPSSSSKVFRWLTGVFLCLGWTAHLAGHVSFASSHEGKRPFETTLVPAGAEGEDVGSIEQMLWCVCFRLCCPSTLRAVAHEER